MANHVLRPSLLAVQTVEPPGWTLSPTLSHSEKFRDGFERELADAYLCFCMEKKVCITSALQTSTQAWLIIAQL